MSGELEPKIKVNPENLKARYEMVMTLFHDEFVVSKLHILSNGLIVLSLFKFVKELKWAQHC